MSRKFILGAVSVLAGVSVVLGILWASTVQAASPIFVESSGVGPNWAGELVVDFRLAGLGPAEVRTVTLSADGFATYTCEGGEGKETVEARVSSSQTYNRANQIVSYLKLSPPVPALQCDTILAGAYYLNVHLDEDDARTETVPGIFD